MDLTREIIANAVNPGDLRTTILDTHMPLNDLDTLVAEFDKEIQLLQDALDPVSIRNHKEAVPPGPAVSTGGATPQPERSSVAIDVFALRCRIESTVTRVAALREWVATLRHELRI